MANKILFPYDKIKGIMEKIMSLFYYLFWHYSSGLIYLFKESLRWIRAMSGFFCIKHHLRTLFYPWHQLTEAYNSGFSPGKFLWTFSGNMIARVLGAIARLLIIFSGVVAVILTLIFSVFRLALWIIMPLAIPVSLGLGIISIFY